MAFLTHKLAPSQVSGLDLFDEGPWGLGLWQWHGGKESNCQCRRCQRHRFNPWVRKVPSSKKWKLTPVFLPGKLQGQRSLVGYIPSGHKGSYTTENTQTHRHRHTHTHHSPGLGYFVNKKDRFWESLLQSPNLVIWPINPYRNIISEFFNFIFIYLFIYF